MKPKAQAVLNMTYESSVDLCVYMSLVSMHKLLAASILDDVLIPESTRVWMRTPWMLAHTQLALQL